MNTSFRHNASPNVMGQMPGRQYRLSHTMTKMLGILLLYCGALLSGVASAECGPTPGGPPTECPGSSVAGLSASGGPGAGAGNPINVITGNKYQREEDMPALPGVLGLEIVRHYNSAYSKPGWPNGPMGREWKLSYETELLDKFGRVQILQADGGRVIFNRDPNNPGLCSTPRPADGRMAIQPRPNGSLDYTWTWSNGRRLHFNSAGKLERIVAPTGEAVELHYNGNNTLAKVVDPQGRSLTLSYPDRERTPANDRFRGVQHIDSPVGRFSYEYGSALPKGGVLFDARNLLANMVRVRLPSSYKPDQKARPSDSRGAADSTVSRVYHHEDPRFPWLLTGISVETAGADGKPVATRFATFGYDDNARANLSTHANNVGKVTLDTREAGKTVLTNSLGQRTVYRHAIVGDQHRLLEVRGAGCATCGESNVRYAYDRLGQLTETTRLAPNGEPVSTTKSELDALGRTVRVSKVDYQDGKPGPARWLLRLEYLGDGGAPAVVARPSVVPGREVQTRVAYNDAGQPLSVTDTGWAPAHDGKRAAGALERSTTYRYAIINGRSLLTRIDGPLANGKTNGPLDSDVTVFEYDNRPASDTEKKVLAEPGKLTQYDERDRREGVLTGVIMPGNFKSTFKYDAAGRIAAVSDAAGHATRLSYTPRGQPLSQTRDGVTYTAAFDGLDNPLEVGRSDMAGKQSLTRLGYDDAGRLVWSASRLGILTTRRYDTEGRILETATQSNAIKQARTYTYDPLGRLLAATDAGGGRWGIAWNERGLPDELTDALGRATRYRYDGAGDIVGVAQAANTPEAQSHNTETRFELDVNGRPVGVVAPNGAATRYVRDDFGRVVATTSPDSGTTTRRFDAAGRLVAGTDAKGNQAGYESDVAGRITRQTVTEAGAGATAVRRQTVTTWRYAGAQLAAIEHPEQSERYAYDASGRLVVKTVTVALAGGAKASYDTHYRYDGMGQLVGVSLPDGSQLDYQRNGQNQIVGLDRSPVRTSWLRWLLPRQHIVKDLERDVVGLKRLTYGNGIEALYQRSREGALTRIVYRDPRISNADPQRSASLETLLGIGQAVAAPAPAHGAKQPMPPGALALPPDPAALLDHRYLWDVQGNLLHTKDRDEASGYAYDAFDRLIAAGTVSSSPKGAATFDRYHFDVGGNRLLAQEGVASQSDMLGNTVKASYAPDSNRWQGAEGNVEQVAASYDAAGQPERIGARNYVWDALGKLLEVRQGRDRLAGYRYNHRGERIAKDLRGTRTYYLYDEDRNLAAELNADGKVSRQYLYLAGQAVAVIDTPASTSTDDGRRGSLARIMADIATIWGTWFGHGATIAYLQTNHLGAAELATDASGKPVWRAAYAPFGKLRPVRVPGQPAALQLNLRLPGQYADQETGLYYNDHRYYDPARGRYLTPDPLGLRGGANGYAYVGGNPLKYVDPYGLVLFAFDGTNNGETPKNGDSISNVRKLFLAYDENMNGKAYYITGIGTTNKDMQVEGDVLSGDGFDARVALGFSFLNQVINSGTDMVNIDVVGFSRGAAEARVWMNQLVGKLVNGTYTDTATGNSRCLNLRFEGLWDTVSHLGLLSGDDAKYDFSIPPEIKYVAQAVALNEHRGGPANFNARSIFDAPQLSSVANRTELGFVGSHADIGGGYGTGDLSDVALMWMIQQAKNQGISFSPNIIKDAGWDTVTSPILHDMSNNRFAPKKFPLTDDRDFIYGKDTRINQAKALIGGENTVWARQFASYYADWCGPVGSPAGGLVDMKKYGEWLTTQGISINFVIPQTTALCE